jgi:hypothetical protein
MTFGGHRTGAGELQAKGDRHERGGASVLASLVAARCGLAQRQPRPTGVRHLTMKRDFVEAERRLAQAFDPAVFFVETARRKPRCP